MNNVRKHNVVDMCIQAHSNEMWHKAEFKVRKQLLKPIRDYS